MSAIDQIKYFTKDVHKMVGQDFYRLLTVIFSRSFWGILLCRFERFAFLVFGRWYRFLRVPLIPLFNLIQAYSNIEIPYLANVRGGLSIFHPSLGCCLSQYSDIGEDVILYGGNVIGTRRLHKGGIIAIGDRCVIGVNAIVLGPIRIANDCRIGASSVVLRDCLIENSTLTGSPAVVKQ